MAWKEEGQGEGGGGGGGQDAEGWSRGVTGLWVYVGSLRFLMLTRGYGAALGGCIRTTDCSGCSSSSSRSGGG
eukprot:2473898-Rhodomonas_salina.1